jgi:HEAT repeat protein
MRAPIVSTIVFFVTLEAVSIMMPPAVYAAPRMTKKNPAPECDQRGRVKAVRTAGEALSPEAVQLLAESLGDARPKVRKEAIKALSRLVDPASIDLIGRLATRGAKEHQRAGAVEVLGKILSTSAVDPLKAALRDPSPKVRACALGALRGMADPATADGVVEKLKDANPLVRAAAVEALAAVQPKEAVARIEPCLGDREVPVRVAAVECLCRAAPDGAAAVVKRALADPAWQVRVAGIESAEKLRRPELIPLLIERLAAEKGRLVGDLVRALRHLTGKEIGVDPKGWKAWWENVQSDFRCPEPRKAGAAAPAGGTVATFCNIPIYSQRVAFVLDLSGSMRDAAGEKPDGPRKVDVVKAELHKAIRAFTPDTRFNIILLGSDAQGRFDAKDRVWAPRLVPASSEAKAQAARFSSRQVARGFTNLYDAVLLAFQDPDVDTVILLSDGGASRGAFVARQEILEEVLAANRYRKIAVHTVASGARREGDLWLLTELAARTGGLGMKENGAGTGMIASTSASTKTSMSTSSSKSTGTSRETASNASPRSLTKG